MSFAPYKKPLITDNFNSTSGPELLLEAFDWAWTAEGSEYWNDVYIRLRALERAEYYTHSLCPPPLNNAENFTKMQHNFEKLLLLVAFIWKAFNWSATHEGADFWRFVYASLNKKVNLCEVLQTYNSTFVNGIVQYMLSEGE